jgi:uncharacterized RDD family membrane protein YckC
MSSLPPASASPPNEYADKLTIETPEQTAVEFPIAGVGSRFLAFALDTLIQLAASAVVGIGFVTYSAWIGFSGSSRSTIWVLSLVGLFFFALYFGYFAFFEAIWNGQTPGKRVARIRVIKETGRPINPPESLARNLMRLVDQLPAFYATGIVSVLLSRKSKRLGDFVAGTIVVHERSLQDIKPLWQAASGSTTFPYGSRNLSPEDFALIEAFLNRRDSLAPDVRYRMADQIVTRVRPQILLPPGGDALAGEKLLEALAQERRSSAGYL